MVKKRIRKTISYNKYKELEEDCNFWRMNSKRNEKSYKAWSMAFFVLLFLSVEVVLIIVAINNHVDEHQFCLDKLNRWYAEYDWTAARYSPSKDNVCIGTYNLPGDKTVTDRDHLEEVVETDTAEKTFGLTSDKEIKYLARDDYSEWWWAIWVIAWICIFGVIYGDGL